MFIKFSYFFLFVVLICLVDTVASKHIRKIGWISDSDIDGLKANNQYKGKSDLNKDSPYEVKKALEKSLVSQDYGLRKIVDLFGYYFSHQNKVPSETQTMFFVGKAGTGKTWAAEIMHETLYPTEEERELLWFDMKEFAPIVGMTAEYIEKMDKKFEAKLSRIFTLYGEDKAVIVFDEFQRASAYQLKLIQSLMDEKHSYVQNIMDLGMFSDVPRTQRYDARNKLLIFTSDLQDLDSSKESYPVMETPLDKFYEEYFCRTKVTRVGYQGNERWMKTQLEHLLATLKLQNPDFLKFISGSSNIVPFFGFDIREDFPKLIKGTLTRMFFNIYKKPMIIWGDDEVFNLIANHRYGIMKTAQDDVFRGIRQIKCDFDDSNPVYRQYAFNARKVDRDIVPKYVKYINRPVNNLLVNTPPEKEKNLIFMTGLHETHKEDNYFEFFITYCVEKLNLELDAQNLNIKKEWIIQRNSDNKAYSCADYIRGAPSTKIISSEKLI